MFQHAHPNISHIKCKSYISEMLLFWFQCSHAVKSGNYKETQHTFQYVFDEYTSQKALYDHVALPLVEDVLKGKNGGYLYEIICNIFFNFQGSEK